MKDESFELAPGVTLHADENGYVSTVIKQPEVLWPGSSAADVITRCHDLHPRELIEVIDMLTNALERQRTSGRLDEALRYGPRASVSSERG